MSGMIWKCPRCGNALTELRDALVCDGDGFQVVTRDGIRDFLDATSLEHHRDFVSTYDAIRAAERRGSTDAAFYLSLPAGGPGREWSRRKKGLDWLHAKLAPPGAAGVAGGQILDAGAGCCWLTRHLAEWGFSPVALDLTVDGRDGLGAGRHYLASLPVRFERVRASFDRLPFADGTFSAVVFNASFHYAEQQDAVLREALRVSQPSAPIFILDSPVFTDPRSGQKMLEARGLLARSTFLLEAEMGALASRCGLTLEVGRGRRRLLGRALQKLTELRLGRETATLSRMVLRRRLA